MGECKWFRVCPMRRFNEKGLVDDSYILSFCKGDWSRCVRYRLEEQGAYHPDSMLPDGTIDRKLEGSG